MTKAGFVPYEKLFVNFRRQDNTHKMTFPHYHDAYEIYFQVSGIRHCFAGNIGYCLEPGDLVIHKPFELHYYQNGEVDYTERYVLNFRMEELSVLLSDVERKMLMQKLNSGMLHLSEEQGKAVFDLFRKADEIHQRKGFLVEKLTYGILLELLMHITEWMSKYRVLEKSRIVPEIRKAIVYINENYKEKLGLDEIAEEAGMSKYYFSRLFHLLTGVTVIEYITNVRLIKAHGLLANTKMSIEEIASCTGFGEESDFACAFKNAYGISPGSFRNRKQRAKGVV